MQSGQYSKTKNAWGAREIAFAAIFITHIISWLFHLNEKQITFRSSYGVWLQKREQEPLLCYSQVLVDDKQPIFPRECLQIPVSHRQMPQFTTKQTELIIFRSPVISNTGIQRSGVYADGHHKRYLLLLQTKGFCSLCCSHTPYDGGNVVCFSFQWNIQQMSCEIKIAANATFRAPRSFRVFEQFWTISTLHVEFFCIPE